VPTPITTNTSTPGYGSVIDPMPYQWGYDAP
jgi:hypothetical protein